MFPSLKSGYANLITSCSHLVLLFVAARIDQPQVWVACLVLISCISFCAWISNFRRGRAIADTPTSKIASAAQGYVELTGHISSAPEYRIARASGSLPCVWYRFVTYRKDSENKWQEVSRGVSDSVFALEDGSDTCMVDPEGAEVTTTHRYTWYEGNYKNFEEQLFPSDELYALGDFTTIGGASSALSLSEDVSALLAEWKKDHPNLLKRFDLDGDGQIGMQEWELARRAAMREVQKQHREIRQRDGVHVMRASQAGLYLLSNLSPQKLKRRYVLWGWFHLLVFFTATGTIAWLGVSGSGVW